MVCVYITPLTLSLLDEPQEILPVSVPLLTTVGREPQRRSPRYSLVSSTDGMVDIVLAAKLNLRCIFELQYTLISERLRWYCEREIGKGDDRLSFFGP